MIKKFRSLYDRSLPVKILTVVTVVVLSVAVLLPILKLASLFGVNIKENAGLNFQVDLPNIFFFFLFGCSSIFVVWLAQKYIHQEKIFDLGFRGKLLKLFLFGFLLGLLKEILRYGIYMANSSNVEYISVIPDDVSMISYILYYLYFFFGFIIWNSFIEELGTRAYPIEKLKKHMHPMIIFTIMGVIFTIPHFVLHKFSLIYCLGLFTSSFVFSLLYFYSNSIWTVVGMHSAGNWFGFSFSGTNWKLGAIMNVQISKIPEWIQYGTTMLLGLLFILLIYILHKKAFFEKLNR